MKNLLFIVFVFTTALSSCKTFYGQKYSYIESNTELVKVSELTEGVDHVVLEVGVIEKPTQADIEVDDKTFKIKELAKEPVFDEPISLENQKVKALSGSYYFKSDFCMRFPELLGCSIENYNDSMSAKNSFKFATGEKINLYKRNSPFQAISIPFKFRLQEKNELSADFNAGIANGWRWEKKSIKPKYKSNKYVGNESNTKALSLLGFWGLTPVKLNTDNTNNNVVNEKTTLGYDYGVTGIIEFDKVNVGLALGSDASFSKDGNDWIYQHKPWGGFVVGLELVKNQ